MKRKIILVAILTISLIFNQFTGVLFANTDYIVKNNAKIKIVDDESKANFDYSSRKLLDSVKFYIDDNGIVRKNTQENLSQEDLSVRKQVDALIASVDHKELLEAALSKQVDYSFPVEIRKSIIANASFQPIKRVKKDEIKLEVTSTVKKIKRNYKAQW